MIQTLPLPSLECCVFLDVDGTLIELTDSPHEAFADQELKVLLGTVAERLGGALALVSGRSIPYLDALFKPLRLPAAGLHGVARRSASGIMYGPNFINTELDRVRPAVKALVEAHPGTSLEDKGQTVAVHFRMAPQHESSVRESLLDISKPMSVDYHIQEGNMVLELMPRGFNKGAAVKMFMQEPPFLGRRPVFVGDDLTDQGGFQSVEEQGGISIAVGDRVRGQYRLDDPAAVRAWLQGVAALHDSRRA
jgi:trehalose 6-phosphate phosphatase